MRKVTKSTVFTIVKLDNGQIGKVVGNPVIGELLTIEELATFGKVTEIISREISTIEEWDFNGKAWDFVNVPL